MTDFYKASAGSAPRLRSSNQEAREQQDTKVAQELQEELCARASDSFDIRKMTAFTSDMSREEVMSKFKQISKNARDRVRG